MSKNFMSNSNAINVFTEVGGHFNKRPTGFVGTRAQWAALTDAQKEQYLLVNITDDEDYISSGNIVDLVADGNMNAVTSNAVYDALQNTTNMLTLSQNVTLSASQPTTVTFSNVKIKSDSIIDVYTNNEAIYYSTMTTSNGSCEIVFPKQSSAIQISVLIRWFDV